MPNCTSPSSWGVTLTPDGGTVSCGAYRARFTVSRIGVVKLVWLEGAGPIPGPDYGRIERAAYQAAVTASEPKA